MHRPDVRHSAELMLARGCSPSAVAVALGVPRRTVQDWRHRRARPDCPVCLGLSPLPAVAYAALLGFYLGDGCVSSRGTRATLRISCDAAYPSIINDVTELIARLRPDNRVFHISAPGAVVVQSNWSRWPCLLPQHGPGRKHERDLELWPWQEEIVDAFPAALLRGLFHSDGSRVANWATRQVAGHTKRYEYPRWQFTNNSAQIHTWCCRALDRIGVGWRRSNWKTTSVSTRADVAALDSLIGLKHEAIT